MQFVIFHEDDPNQHTLVLNQHILRHVNLYMKHLRW